MSLINKMLQDLDARGTPAGDAFPSTVKPVAPQRPAASLPSRATWTGAGMAGVAALSALALAWFAWTHLHAPRPGQKPSAVRAAKPVAARPAQGMRGTIVHAPVAASAPAGQVAPAGAVEPQAIVPTAPAAVQAKSVAPMEPNSADAREARHAAEIELATRDARLARLARMSAPAPAPKTGPAAGAVAAARSGPAASTEPAARTGHAAKAAQIVGGESRGASTAPAEGRQESSFQRAENEYRRALDSLQDGRVSDALPALQLALRIDPGHDAARQTLVGLLVEANRPDDAIRELQLGLARDPRQPALAMLLARLQIERGGSGIETLQRTLPYADNDADYHAFLAGALQRGGRQREAAEQYVQALRGAPGNGVWWMGLGISLQADKRNAEALDAFRKARASGSLKPELQAFVERQIQQLAR